MPNRDYGEELLIYHNRRLQALQKTKALKGSDTPPEILIEIDDIKKEIEELETELSEPIKLRETQFYSQMLSCEEYGIKIKTPTDYENVGRSFRISGTYKTLPEGHVIWISTFGIYEDGDGEKKKRYWPQEQAKTTYTAEGRRWRSKVNDIGGSYTGEIKEYLVLVVGVEGQALFKYFKDAGAENKQYPAIIQLTSDIVECGIGKVTFTL